MAVEFKESRTRENLMRAFAGESQARNRYTIARRPPGSRGFLQSARSSFLPRTRSGPTQPDFMIF